MLDCSSYCQGWHNQLQVHDDFFTNGLVNLGSFFAFKWNHLKTHSGMTACWLAMLPQSKNVNFMAVHLISLF